jgi:pilus assembly protein CpaF
VRPFPGGVGGRRPQHRHRGATQAGKTTLLNCLAAVIPPRERVITCEEVFELQVGLPDTVAMQTRQPNLEGEGEIR